MVRMGSAVRPAARAAGGTTIDTVPITDLSVAGAAVAVASTSYIFEGTDFHSKHHLSRRGGSQLCPGLEVNDGLSLCIASAQASFSSSDILFHDH